MTVSVRAKSTAITLLIGLYLVPAAHAFNFFGTYWETQKGKSYEAVGLGIPASDMQKAFDLHTADGYEMTRLDGYDVGGKVYFNFVFRTRTSSSWTAKFGLTGSSYQKYFDNQFQAGRCLRSLDVYRQGNSPRYAAVFKKARCKPQTAYHGLNAAQHQAKFDDLTAKGWDPVNVSVVSINGQRRYAAFYEKRPGGTALKSFLTRDQLDQQDAQRKSDGWRLVFMDAYTHDQGQLPRFSAIWRKVSKPNKTWANIGGPQVADLGDEMSDSGRYVRYLTGYGVGQGHRFDVAVIKPRRALSTAVSGITN